MTKVQAHRGPDDHGQWGTVTAGGERILLGSRRLAILDLSPAGHMPMSTEDGAHTIAYNGEVYNAPALRAELEQRGHRFRSRTDTEVVLRMYAEFGPECVRRLNGMFAFALWDQPRQQLFLARDHMGIKPFYYAWQGRRLAFASEVKSLLELPDLARRINARALHQYLTFQWVPDPLTAFDGILKLPPGHSAIFKGGELRLTEYWNLAFPTAQATFSSRPEALAEELRERFTRSVRAQMVSDVPLGAFLSAGLDSSSIVAAMAHAGGRPIHTFTVTFPKHYRTGELTLDDTDVARRTAKHFGAQHTEILVEPNAAELLPKVIWHMDEPIADPAVLVTYLLNREARKAVTVLLSGVGGDELFAGYRKHQAHFLAERYRRIPAMLRRGLIEPLVAALPAFRGTRFKGHVRLAKKMARSGSLPPHERFLTDSAYFTEIHKTQLYTPALRAQLAGADPFEQHRVRFARVADADFLNQMLYLDTTTFMVSLNLTYNDKMSMASSVEVRVPFVDWELAEWVAQSVPPTLKLHGQTTKYLLREAFGPWLPPEVLTQRKAGFGAPVDIWLAGELRPLVEDLLGEDSVRARGLFEPAHVRRLIDEHRRGRQDWSAQLWQLLVWELWMRAFKVQPA